MRFSEPEWLSRAEIRARQFERLRNLLDQVAGSNRFWSQKFRAAGIDVVERVPAPTPVTEHNVVYLRTKRDKMGHATLLRSHHLNQPSELNEPASWKAPG